MQDLCYNNINETRLEVLATLPTSNTLNLLRRVNGMSALYTKASSSKGETCPICQTFYPIAETGFYYHKSGTKKGYKKQSHCRKCELKLRKTDPILIARYKRNDRNYRDRKLAAKGKTVARDKKELERETLLLKLTRMSPDECKAHRNLRVREIYAGLVSTEEGRNKLRKKWRSGDPVKMRAKVERRRAIKLGCKEHFTKEEWLQLCEKYNNRCLCCKKTDVKLTADHIVALSKGGSNGIENIQPLCQSCNSSKGVKTIDFRGGY